MKDIVFIDVETTGLDPDRHEIIEVAAIRVSPSLEVRSMATARCRPSHVSSADPKALELNGYSAAEWKDAIALKEALERVRPVMEDAIPAGHNVPFDIAFLERAFAGAGLSPPSLTPFRLDTMTLSFLGVSAGCAGGLGLGALCKALDVERARPHSALSDALDSLESVRRMVGMVGKALHGGATEAA